ncbi:hypothetical protein ACWEN3_15485 [Streptomyces sp. NPDC004561]
MRGQQVFQRERRQVARRRRQQGFTQQCFAVLLGRRVQRSGQINQLHGHRRAKGRGRTRFGF